MTDKHTPSPWRVEEDSTIYGSRKDKGDKFEIADCKGYKEEREANAHLIAAAPELLGALINADWLIDELTQTTLTEDSEYLEIFAQIKQAIAKAKGE